MTDVPLVFLHIPKTAGSTLSRMLNRFYPPQRIHTLKTPDIAGAIAEFRGWPDERRHAVALLKGHQPFGLHALLAPGARYITVLRHPVPRIISHYHYLRNNPGHFMHERLVKSGLDVASYAGSGLFPELDNGQTRQIAAVPDDRPATRADLARALDHIDRHFAWVGITERFDESLVGLAARMRWLDVTYRKHEVGQGWRRESVDAATTRAIEAANALDLALYDRVLAWFDAASVPVRWARRLGARALGVANLLANRDA
jgi:hypothetical protein